MTLKYVEIILIIYFPDARWNRKLGRDWFSWVELDRALWSLVRLDSTQLDTQPNVQNRRTCDNLTSCVELCRGLWSDSTQPFELSWVRSAALWSELNTTFQRVKQHVEKGNVILIFLRFSNNHADLRSDLFNLNMFNFISYHIIFIWLTQQYVST